MPLARPSTQRLRRNDLSTGFERVDGAVGNSQFSGSSFFLDNPDAHGKIFFVESVEVIAPKLY